MRKDGEVILTRTQDLSIAKNFFGKKLLVYLSRPFGQTAPNYPVKNFSYKSRRSSANYEIMIESQKKVKSIELIDFTLGPHFQKPRFEKINSEPKNFDDADQYCRSRNGRLAFIESESDYHQFMAIQPPRDEFLGAKKSKSSGDWKNVDGSKSFLKWDTDQPDNWKGSENCLHIRHNFLMNDVKCLGMLYFSCRYN